MKVQEQAIGRRVRCPRCETLLVVPNPAEMEAEEEESEELPVEPSPVEPNEDEPEAEQADPAAQRETEAWSPPKKKSPFAEVAPAAHGTPPPISAPVTQQPQPKPKPQASNEPPLILPPQSHPEDLIDMTAMVDIVF